MKTTIGGDRLGSGQKEHVTFKTYNRSTHDLSYTWRSSMSAGTLVPFMSQVGLPGDTFDIDLDCNVMTLPTIGPLFGSFKVQLDVFQVPIRLYNAQLHMNKLGIGMEMQNIKLPVIEVRGFKNKFNENLENSDNAQINSSCILKYLGMSGIGRIVNTSPSQIAGRRSFNAVSFLAYWDIYKNYYANKQEERGFAIHTTDGDIILQQSVTGAYAYGPSGYIGNAYNVNLSIPNPGTTTLAIQYPLSAAEPSHDDVEVSVGGSTVTASAGWNTRIWIATATNMELRLSNPVTTSTTTYNVPPQTNYSGNPISNLAPGLVEFPLENIDTMRSNILQWNQPTVAYKLNNETIPPYKFPIFLNGGTDNDVKHQSSIYSQEGLGIKTYQSDLFNNWISTEWIDGTNGINEITAVSTTGDAFTIDALNLASKVYNMLNRIAISGGSYDDWLDAVYTHERTRSVESPVYLGSLIKELAFEEVISQSEAQTPDGGRQPLGQLAGRGRLTGKNKGGKITVKVDEPSYVMGIVSLTPRIDYSQGNAWDVNLESMNDLHKPALDAIGYQDLITEQMAWQDSTISATNQNITKKSAGKQPAWLNYMTNVNKTYGNFADEYKEMFMTLNRKYTIGNNGIEDLTTYIDPQKYNFVFAETNLDSQNFWVQIRNNITARRKMSAKVIPNL